MPAHTHDGVDWAARLADLRQADAANAVALRAVADRLIEAVPAPHPTVIDVGSGAGGMSAALAGALVGRAARATTGTTDIVATPTHAANHPTAGPDTATPPSDPATASAGALDADHARSAAGSASASHAAVHSGDIAARPGDEPIAVSGIGANTDHPTSAASSAPTSDAAATSGATDRADPARSAAGSAPTSTAVHTAEPAASSASAASANAGSAVAQTWPAGGAVDQASAAGGTTGQTAAAAASVAAHFSDLAPQSAGHSVLFLVDMVPELLAAAGEAAVTAVRGSGAVDVRAVQGDVADPASFAGLPPADLVWASNVVHHLPDQRAAVSTLVGLLGPGGCLALAEGGLSMRCLPWDVGVGEPGLQDRLIAAHGTWFHRMRTDMPDAVRLPVGWNQVLSDAGLNNVTAFSYLVDVPAPLSADGRGAVVSWLTWMSHEADGLLAPADTAALRRLVDPDDPAFVGRRDDIFMLKASTVYLGWR